MTTGRNLVITVLIALFVCKAVRGEDQDDEETECMSRVEAEKQVEEQIERLMETLDPHIVRCYQVEVERVIANETRHPKGGINDCIRKSKLDNVFATKITRCIVTHSLCVNEQQSID